MNIVDTKEDDYQLVIRSFHPWYVRLWVLITNPFTYLFKGYIRY